MNESRQEEANSDHPSELGESYQKARRSYGLFAALLLAWELVGIELTQENLNVRLLNPEAAPWVLLVLVAYFGARITLEWIQAHPSRKAMRAARVDFGLAHLIGVIAVAALLIQAALERQLFDYFDPEKAGAYVVFAVLGYPVMFLALIVRGLMTGNIKWRGWGVRQFVYYRLIMAAILGAIAMVSVIRGSINVGWALIAFFIGLSISFGLLTWLEENEENSGSP